MQTVEPFSVMSCKQWSLTLWRHAHSGVWLCDVMHTVESDYVMSCKQWRLTLWCHANSGVWLCDIMQTVESDSAASCTHLSQTLFGKLFSPTKYSTVLYKKCLFDWYQNCNSTIQNTFNAKSYCILFSGAQFKIAFLCQRRWEILKCFLQKMVNIYVLNNLTL